MTHTTDASPNSGNADPELAGVARLARSSVWQGQRWRPPRAVRHDKQRASHGDARKTALYQLTDRLHEERKVQVTIGEIESTVSAWLAELGTDSPLVADLAHAVRVVDWPKLHALGDCLSVEITVVA